MMTSSGSSAISIRRRRPPRLSASTGSRSSGADVAAALVESDAHLQPLVTQGILAHPA
jgi:hypothetical protein